MQHTQSLSYLLININFDQIVYFTSCLVFIKLKCVSLNDADFLFLFPRFKDDSAEITKKIIYEIEEFDLLLIT